MKAKIVGILIAAATILTACVDTPDNLLESSSNLGEESSSEDLSAIERQISLEELRNNKEQLAEDICDASYDNLIFQNGLNFEVPDEVGKHQVIYPDRFQDNADKLFAKYIPEDMYDEDKIIDDTTYPFGPYFEDPQTGLYVAVGCNGFFSYAIGDGSSQYAYSSEFASASYYIGRGSASSSSVLPQTEVNAVQAAQDYANEFTDYISYPNEFDVAILTKYKPNNRDDLYIAYLQTRYKGLRVFNTISRYGDFSFEVSLVGGGIVCLDSKLNLEVFTASEILEDYKTMQIIDAITSPKWAARALSDELASNLEYDVVGIELAYVPVFIENAEKKIAGTQIHANRLTRASYNVYELTPYWIFYFDVTPDKQVLGMVNCIDGSVEFMNNAR